MKRVRPLPLRTFAPRPSRAPHVSRAPVDGGGRGRYDDAGADLVKPEKHAVGDGNADGDGVGAHRWRQCTGTRAHIFLPHPHPRRLTLWSGALALAFALVPVPVPVLLPRPHPCIHPRPRCVVRNAQASSCTGPRTYPRTRRDGEVRVPTRANPPSHRAPSSYALVFLGCVRICTGHRGGEGANSGLYAALARVIELSRRDVCAYPRRRHCLLPTWIRWCALRGSGYTFGCRCALACRWRWGWRIPAGAL
jgi:hypothetical protein